MRPVRAATVDVVTVGMLDPAEWRIAEIPDGPPLLVVVVDTEEEFDWARPLARENRGATNLKAQHRAHKLFDRYGLVPTYVIDHPVATSPDGYGPLSELLADKRCEIGAHLHPWVNPPFDEAVNNRNSYPGNLPRALEREKLTRLTDAIAERFGFRPTVYKAGRYGVGPATTDTLDALGYRIDASVVPMTDFTPEDGPDFSACDARPYWFGPGGRMLEVPLSVTYVGALSAQAARLYPTLAGSFGRRLHVPGMLARLGILERLKLTPEGADHAEHRALTETMRARGHRVFSFTYHSPSLAPGNTPYVRDEAGLNRFLDTFERYFDYFFGTLGGRATTLTALYAMLAPPKPQ